MKVRVETLVPLLAECMGKQEREVEFEGASVRDLIDHLLARYGARARRALCDEQGELDPVVQVLLNNRTWIGRDQLGSTPLHEGDHVKLLMLMAGG